MLNHLVIRPIANRARPSIGRLVMRALSSQASLHRVNAVSQSSFTSNHELYDAVRSGYPIDAVRCAISKRAGNDILEVAAGTGKFTEALLALLPSTARVTAVEPSPGMLKSFTKKLPSIPAIQASSDELPFEDASFDTIYVAQAFHWFATRESLAEFRRVLRPSGSLVLVWNYENYATMDPDGWQARTTALMHSYDHDVPQYRHMNWIKTFEQNSDLFEPIRERKWACDMPIESPEFYWRYWDSRSYITALDPETKAKVKEQMMKILGEYDLKQSDLVAKRGTHVVWTHPAHPEPEVESTD